MDKIITFQDWDEGRVIHWCCEAYIPFEAEAQIIRFNWEDVSNEDIEKIKSKQSEIFNEETSRILSLWKQIFTSNLSEFSNKEKYIENELSDMRIILSIDESLNVVHHSMPFLNHKGLVFDEESLSQIRDYFQGVILLGKNRSFDFINSRNFKYQHLNKTPSEIYAQVCWYFYNWLLKFNIEIESIDKIETSENEKVATEIEKNNANFNALLSIFENNQNKVDIVKKAIYSLNITKYSTERQITAFVDASKMAGILPLTKNINLIYAIYCDLSKPLPKHLKSRTDGNDYKLMLKSAKKYYGLI